MKPKDFCREWLGATESEILTRGYHKRCVELLAWVTRAKVPAVDRWGSRIEFDQMPPRHEATLGYAIAIKRVIEAALSENPELFEAIVRKILKEKSL